MGLWITIMLSRCAVACRRARCFIRGRELAPPPRTASHPISSLATSTVHPQPRRLLFTGINDRIKSMLSAREEKKLDAKFEKLATSLLATDQLTLFEWKLQIEDRMSDWRVQIGSKLPGIRDSMGVVRVQQQLAIMNSFTEVELQAMHSVNTRVKNRVTQQSGVSELVARDFFRQFLDMQELHEWLHSRRSSGLPMPQTMAAAQDMILKDRADPALSKKERKTKAKRRR